MPYMKSFILSLKLMKLKSEGILRLSNKIRAMKAHQVHKANSQALWSPRDRKLWYLDIEHDEFHPLAKWDAFIAEPGRYLNGIIEGEFER